MKSVVTAANDAVRPAQSVVATTHRTVSALSAANFLDKKIAKFRCNERLLFYSTVIISFD